jgi:hypothetical protein
MPWHNCCQLILQIFECFACNLSAIHQFLSEYLDQCLMARNKTMLCDTEKIVDDKHFCTGCIFILAIMQIVAVEIDK